MGDAGTCTGRDCLGEPGKGTTPGVRFVSATLCLLAFGCQNSAEVAQVVEELQCPVLGYWECAFSLQVNPHPVERWLLLWHNERLCVLSSMSEAEAVPTQGQFNLTTTAGYVRNFILKPNEGKVPAPKKGLSAVDGYYKGTLLPAQRRWMCGSPGT